MLGRLKVPSFLLDRIAEMSTLSSSSQGESPLAPTHSQAPTHWQFVALMWILALAAVAIARYRRDWGFVIAWHRWMADHGVPAAVRNFDSLMLFAVVAFLGAFIASRMYGGTSTGHLALKRGRSGWARVVLLALLPMVGGGAIIAALCDGPPQDAAAIWPKILSGVIRAPIMEELLFRGLLIGANAAVLTWAGQRFWINAVAAALLFALTHVDWTPSGVVSGWPTLLVTAAGGLWYAWLLARWRSLWVPMILHAGMNFGWMLAGARGGAGGGGLTVNILRIATIVIATAMTIRTSRLHRTQT